jgi:hypothetical protein
MKPLLLGLAAAVATLIASPARAQEKPPGKLTWETYDSVRDRVLPTQKEKGWQAIPWRSDILAAVAEATDKNLPLLIWAMNGDPLGCT